MKAKSFTVCAWCFPGLRIIDGVEVTHSVCAMHKWRMEFEHLFLTSEWQSWWQQGVGLTFDFGHKSLQPPAL